MKILLISYHFPPFNSVGALRPGKMAAFFHNRGHDVTVITDRSPPFETGLPTELPNNRVKTVASFSMKKLITILLGGRRKIGTQGYYGGARFVSLRRRLARAYKAIFCWPDTEVGFSIAARRAGERIIRRQHTPFDLIVVSVSPFSSIWAGAKLAQRFQIPLVVDYRDLWTENHFNELPRWRRGFDERMEASVLKKASLLVTVSKNLADSLSKHSIPTITVRNGHDLRDSNAGQEVSAKQRRIGEKFRIVYTGSIYEGFQDTDALCCGVCEWVQRGADLEVVVAGRNIHALRRSAERFGLTAYFDFPGVVDYRQARRLQQSADALLFFPWQGGKAGVLTTKLFEYIGAQRPIISVGGNDSEMFELLSRVRNVWLCSDSKSIVSAINEIAQGVTRTPSDALDIMEYSRERQFLKLESKIKSLIRE